MTSGWEVYYCLCLSAALALLIPAGLYICSLVVSFPKKYADKRQYFENQLDPPPAEAVLDKKMNSRFFVGMNIILILVALVLLAIPGASVLRAEAAAGGGPGTLIIIISVSLLTALGLFYSSRKGDLDWMTSYLKRSPEPGPEDKQ